MPNFISQIVLANQPEGKRIKKDRHRSKEERDARRAEKLDRKINKVHDEFKNLTITVKNNQPASQNNRGQRERVIESSHMKGTNEHGNENQSKDIQLKRLMDLQKGKLSSNQMLKTNPLPRPVKQKISQDEECERNRAEVQQLNAQIQSKIAQQIKPKLRQIIDRENTNSLNGYIRPSHRRKTASPAVHELTSLPLRLPRQTRSVPFTKSVVKLPSDEEVEIFRYSQDDLYQLQSAATWEKVPGLLVRGICATNLAPDDELLMKLLGMKDEKRQEEILRVAEKKHFVKRSGEKDFKFCLVDDPKQQCDENATQQRSDEDEEAMTAREINHIRLSAKNDDELNDFMYKYEFSKLFGDALKDENLKNQPLPEIVKLLVDNNQAHIIEGEVRVNNFNHQESYVSHPSGGKDVCIHKLILRKHAFHGDFVRVLVKQGTEENATDGDLNSSDETGLRNTGCVVEILEKRHTRRTIGSICTIRANKKERKNITINVRDPKIPSVKVNIAGIPKDVELSDKMLMVVEITSWKHDLPLGKIIEIIGEKGALKAENAAILVQNNLDPRPFSQHIIDQLPTEPFAIPASEFEYREDLRKKCIFSIDPETARDLDDALSCEVLANGNLEIGVHISDVTYFLKENSELDEIVREKATTIYLVDTVYHMLPVPLCLLCSLLPGADKMAYSVFWEMKEDTAEIISTRFTRSIVNSCGKLSYEHAQMVIEKNDPNWSELEGEFPEVYNGFTVSDIANVIVKLQKLAVIMREKRKENGALKIDQPKIAFKFDKDDQRMDAPIDFFKYCIKDSNRLIEEFMLLANISVAKFIYDKFPKISLLRQHDPPNESGLKKLVTTLQKFGLEFDTSSSSSISDSMERLISTAKATQGMNAALNLMVSKTMTRARYFCSDTAKEEPDFWHYALSIPMYTHFTSPIRRYADVLVHRVLNAALDYEDPPSRTPEEIQDLANVCNAQKYAAKLAGDDSSNLYFMQFIRSLKAKAMIASVVGVYDFNLECVLVETGHVIKVYYKVSEIFLLFLF